MSMRTPAKAGDSQLDWGRPAPIWRCCPLHKQRSAMSAWKGWPEAYVQWPHGSMVGVWARAMPEQLIPHHWHL